MQNCELRCLAAPSPRPRGAIYLLAWEPFRSAGLGSAGSGGKCAGCGAAWLGVSLGLTIIYQVCDLGETLRLLSFSFFICEMGPKMIPTVSGASDKMMKELRCFSSISSNTKVEGIKPNCCLALFQEKRSSMSEIACLLQSQGPEEASPGSSWL